MTKFVIAEKNIKILPKVILLAWKNRTKKPVLHWNGNTEYARNKALV